MNSKISDRIIWIDKLRGICMLLILWFHTEMYYAGSDVISYHLYVCNALTTFFFLSGSLFYTRKAFSLHRKLKSVLRNIIVPYFFFTSILAVPKALVNHLTIGSVLLDILTGQASWFMAALIVAEIVFALVLWLNNQWVFHSLPIAALAGAILLNDNEWVMTHNYWYYQSALIALVFIYLGYQYHQYERHCQLFHHPLSFIFLLISLILIKIYVQEYGLSQLVAPVIISSFPVFLADMTCSILLAISLCRWLPALHCLQWVGRLSLIYYFFCGAVPLLVAKLLVAFHFPYLAYWQIPIAFLLVCTIITAIVWIYDWLKQKNLMI